MPKIAIVKANFNKEITGQLLKEAEKILRKHQVRYDIFEVAGSFEIPCLISKLAHRYDGFVALGCLIKGETLHFEIIAYAVCCELMQLSVKLKKPIGFGILTLLHEKQAKVRIKNGARAALAALRAIFHED